MAALIAPVIALGFAFCAGLFVGAVVVVVHHVDQFRIYTDIK